MEERKQASAVRVLQCLIWLQRFACRTLVPPLLSNLAAMQADTMSIQTTLANRCELLNSS